MRSACCGSLVAKTKPQRLLPIYLGAQNARPREFFEAKPSRSVTAASIRLCETRLQPALGGDAAGA